MYGKFGQQRETIRYIQARRLGVACQAIAKVFLNQEIERREDGRDDSDTRYLVLSRRPRASSSMKNFQIKTDVTRYARSQCE